VVVDTAGGAALKAAYSLVKRGGLLLTCAGMPSEDRAKELGITARGAGARGTEPFAKIVEPIAAERW
jgi:NADPH:quinone reductase-like Zn-dependent oxidoreductase